MADLATGRVAVVLEGYSGLAGGLTGGAIKASRSPRISGSTTSRTSRPSPKRCRASLPAGWNVLLAPVGTPDAIIQKASADLRKALDESELKAKLGAMGAYLHPMTPAEVTAFAEEQQRTWRPVAEHVAKQAAEQSK